MVSLNECSKPVEFLVVNVHPNSAQKDHTDSDASQLWTGEEIRMYSCDRQSNCFQGKLLPFVLLHQIWVALFLVTTIARCPRHPRSPMEDAESSEALGLSWQERTSDPGLWGRNVNGKDGLLQNLMEGGRTRCLTQSRNVIWLFSWFFYPALFFGQTDWNILYV